MKITYLKLENYIGVYEGLNRYIVEIDFTKTDKTFISLMGRNGSGKSTILSTLSPFSGSNDGRKQIILDGKIGSKEIHYKIGNDKYEIVHTYSKTTKSYIKKNGNELNPNGGVKMFKDIILNEFGIDETFFKIARQGSNMTNFIDLTPSDRKNYISKFIPDISQYLSYYKTVNEKYKLSKKKLVQITNELNDLPLKETLEYELKDLNEKNAILVDKINNSKIQIALYKNKLDELNDYKGDNIYLNEVNEMKKQYSTALNTLNTYLNNYPHLKELSDTDISNNINNVNIKLSSNKQSLDNDITELLNLKNKRSKIKDDIDIKETNKSTMNDNVTSLPIIEKQIDDMTSDLNDVILENNSLINIYGGNKLSIKPNTFINKKIINMYNAFIDLDSDSKAIIISGNPISNNIKELELKLESINTEIESLKNNISKYKVQVEQLDSIKHIPDSCDLSICPYMKQFSGLKGVDKKLIECEEMLKNNISIKTDIINKLNILNEANTFINNYISGSELELYLNPTKCNSLLDALSLITKSLGVEEIFMLKELILYNDNLDTIKAYNETLEKNKLKLEIYLKDKSIIKLVEDDLNRLYAELDDINKSISNYESNIEIYKTNISKLERQLVIYNDLVKSKDTISDIEKRKDDVVSKYNNYKDNHNLYFTILEKSNEAESELATHNKEHIELDKELKKYNFDLLKRIQYEEDYANSVEENNKLALITESLSPTKGIPIHFIGNYLNNIRDNTNELLDLAYNGKFYIDFEITEKDFFIKVFKESGEELSDITIASQGEMALTTVSLSLAMIQEASTSYNIIYLDEMDAPLDAENRRIFIDLLNEQVTKLGSEQVFIISHNSEFDNSSLGLILLKNNTAPIDDLTYMKDKDILFNYQD